MKRLLLVFLISGCAVSGPSVQQQSMQQKNIGNLIVRGIPDIPPTITESLRSYQNTRSSGLWGWSGDSVIIATRFAQTTQIHRVEQPLGARQQMTFGQEPVARVYMPPNEDAEGFIYLKDVGGSEFYQLFWYDNKTGRSTLRSDGKSRYGQVVWSKEADKFAYATNERDGRSWDLHAQNLSGDKAILLEPEEGSWAPLDWAPGGQRLLVTRYVSINESMLYEFNIVTGELLPLLDETLKVAFNNAAYSSDGKGVFFTSDIGAEFMRLHYLDLGSSELEVITGSVPWNVEEFVIAPSGDWLAFITNENGWSRLQVMTLPERRFVALPILPEGIILSLEFKSGADELALSINRPMAPTDVYSINLSSRNLVRWTKSEVGGLNLDNLSAPELISYPTFDDRKIPAFLFKPKGAGPHPVVINIHGGPESQYRPYFSPTTQYMTQELGIAVIAPNVRGSNGYGKSYLKLDNGFKREDSVKDIGALLDWIENSPELDASRVVVSGGSYGGYMVLAALVHYPDRLVAGVERVGISNFVTFLENTQDYRKDLRRVEYGDERDAEMRKFLHEISPLTHVSAIIKPLMISQGFNDPRVPVTESEQIALALEKRKVPVWYVLAMDEGHGFRKKSNRDFNTRATMLFLKQQLFDE